MRENYETVGTPIMDSQLPRGSRIRHDHWDGAAGELLDPRGTLVNPDGCSQMDSPKPNGVRNSLLC